jgi:hypothetical protein
MKVIENFPPPEDGILYLIADSSEKDKRGKKTPRRRKEKGVKKEHIFLGFVL